MSVLVNVIVLGAIAPFVPLPTWSWAALGVFAAAGVLGTWLGRGLSLAAVRRIGSARSNAFLISSPVFAAVTGWLLLGERVGVIQGLGAVLVFVGLGLLVRSRVVAESLVVEPDTSSALAGVAVTPSPRARLRRRLMTHGDPRTSGFVLASSSAILFGIVFVVRKWALVRYPSPVVGAFVGALTSFVLIAGTTAAAKRTDRIVQDNFRRIPIWFIAAGLLTSIGLVAQFSAFSRIPAWMVSLLQGTQALWTLLWGFLFIRQEERIGRELVLSVLLIFGGVGVISLT